MPELNKANRQVCDVDIRILKTMAPFLFFDTANTTTAGLTGSSVHAMAKGQKRIGFQNPIEGTMSIEAQVYPFKFFSLFSDGVVESDAVYAATETVVAEAAGSLKITAKGEVQAGTVFVYPAGMYGDDSAVITGTFADGAFTAEGIEAEKEYIVGYLVSRKEGVKRISFNDNKIPEDLYITMSTVDKDDQGVFTPFLMIAHKATIQRNFELSFASEGEPATVTMTFDLLATANGDILDMVELTGDAE